MPLAYLCVPSHSALLGNCNSSGDAQVQFKPTKIIAACQQSNIEFSCHLGTIKNLYLAVEPVQSLMCLVKISLVQNKSLLKKNKKQQSVKSAVAASFKSLK